MLESVSILFVFWLFDDIKISTKSIQKSKDIKINKKRLKDCRYDFIPVVKKLDQHYLARIYYKINKVYII